MSQMSDIAYASKCAQCLESRKNYVAFEGAEFNCMLLRWLEGKELRGELTKEEEEQKKKVRKAHVYGYGKDCEFFKQK